MNTPEILWEGRIAEGFLPTILGIIKKLMNRKGRLLWVDTD